MEKQEKGSTLQSGVCVLELRLDSFPGTPLPDDYTKDIFALFGLTPEPPVIRKKISTYWHFKMPKETYEASHKAALAYVKDLYDRNHVMEYSWVFMEPAEYDCRLSELQAMLHGRSYGPF